MPKMNILLPLFFTCLVLLPSGSAAALPETVPIVESLIEEPIFGGRVYFREAGVGRSPSILLVHGLGDLASRTWEKLIPELARDYHVLAVDLPGFGRSDKRNALYSPERYAAFLRWLVDRQIEGPLMVVGHSLGGAVALRFAADYPRRIERLVLVDVAGLLHRNVITREVLEPNLQERLPLLPTAPLGRIDDWFGSVISRLPGLPIDLDEILGNEMLRGRFLAGDPARIAALALVQDDFSSRLREVRAPTVILWGADDQVTPLRTGVLLEAVLPQASLQVIPGAGHVPMFDQPALFARALRQGLTGPVALALPSPPHPAAGRIGICRGETGMTLTGPFERLEISDCRDVRLVDVSAAAVTVTRSRITIDKGRISSSDTALRIVDSTVTATGLTVEGRIAISLRGSRLDLAGGTLIGRESAVTADTPARLLFSVSRAESPHFQGFLHGLRAVGPDRPL